MMCTPIRSSCNSVEWQSSMYNHITKKDNDYIKACDLAIAEIGLMTMTELYTHLVNTVPLFDFRTKYDNQELSKSKLFDWLKITMGLQNAMKMLEELFDLANHTSARKHCIYLYGPPNTGKSTFMQLIADALINCCYMSNKHESSFSFSNLLDCRMCLWDEPEIPAGGNYILKLLPTVI